MDGFKRGEEYRRQQLLDFVGSRQAQSGVIWGDLRPTELICTTGGRHGKKAGYIDEQLSDGSWHYFGQGMLGSQDIRTAANSRLASSSTTVFLFTCREPSSSEVKRANSYGKLYKHVGQFIVAGHDLYIPTVGKRTEDSLLRFRLIPIDIEPENIRLSDLDTNLRSWIVREEREAIKTGLSLQKYWLRCAAIKAYAYERANGICEGCQRTAPFLRADGSKYLEVHHLSRLADAGPDSPENVAALCPNCHREVHSGADGRTLNSRIRAAILEKERSRD